MLMLPSGCGRPTTGGEEVGNPAYVVVPPTARLVITTPRAETSACSRAAQDRPVVAPSPAAVDDPITTQVPGTTSGSCRTAHVDGERLRRQYNPPGSATRAVTAWLPVWARSASRRSSPCWR